MLQKFSIGLIVSMVVITGLPIIVTAQQETPVTTDTMMTTQDVQPTSQPIPASASEAREARIKELKDKATAKISSVEERRIASKCKSAQSVVTNLQTRLNTVVENRREKYTSLTLKFLELSEKLKVAGVDTSELDTALSELDSSVASSLDTINSYNDSLADLATLDCEADPSGFKLTLDAAREQRAEVIAMQGTFKSTINEKLRPILQNIRTTLEANSINDEDGEQ